MSYNAEYDAQGNQVVPLDSLLPSVLSRVSALPYSAAVGMLQIKYTEFARAVGNIRTVLRIDTQKDVGRYPLPIPAGHFLHSVRSIHIGQQNGSRDGYHFDLPDYWQGWNGLYRGQRYHLDESNALVLYRVPGQDGEYPIHVRVQLVPTSDCLDIPADIAAMYGDGIAAGVAGEAMNVRGKPWYDPGNSVRVMKIFYQAINDAKANAERGKLSTSYMRARRWI